MKTLKISIFALLAIALFPLKVSAHCPLCTAGAGALAVVAARLGISTAAVGLMIGAFSLALGIWMANSLKKKHFKYQDVVVSLGIFIVTVASIMPFIREYRGIYVPFLGEYGVSYALNIFLFGTLVGGAVLFATPYLSKVITDLLKGKKIPFQGMVLTFVLLLILALIFQITL